MTKNPFDTLINRRRTASIKWQKFSDDVIPMWVADMEFATPDVVINALKARLDHPILGYTDAPQSLVDTVVRYCNSRHNWQIDSDNLCWIPGVVPAVVAACEIAGKPGDEIIVLPPVYTPLLEIPAKTGRKRIDVPMYHSNGSWSIDFNLLEKSFTDRTAALLLSSPHNPMGVMFDEDVLYRLAALCAQNNVLLISDEIHCDLILHTEKKHIPTAKAAKEHHASVLTLMSPSKTFNLAGANCSFGYIENPDVLKAYRSQCYYTIPLVPTLSYTAAQAAYSDGWQWYAELIQYLRSNHQYLLESINSIDGLSMEPVEATYLAWISTVHLNVADAYEFFIEAGVGLCPGEQFGNNHYQRLNFACSRAQLEEGVQRIKNAVAAL